MASLRIAVLSPYTDPIIGGISSYTRELVDAYRKLGMEVVGFATAGTSNTRFSVLGPDKFGFIVRVVRKLLACRPHIVHAHSQHWYILIPVVLTKILRPRTRLLFTFHTPVVERLRSLPAALMKLLLHASSCVVFVSRDMMERFHLNKSIRQAVVLAAPETATVSREAGYGTPKRPIVLYSGPFAWPKKVAGVLLLIDAFAEVADRFPEWSLAVLGDGPLRPQVEEKIAKLGLERRVALKGFVSSVFDQVATAEIYAHISFQEGLPLSVLDAMGLGTTVLATTVGGIPEVVVHRETGYLVAPQREAVKAGLTALIGDKALRRRLAEDARKYVITNMTWEKAATQYIRLAVHGEP